MTIAVSSSSSSSLLRALLVPLVVAVALGALLFRPASPPSLGTRPPLPKPIQLDQLVPITAQSAVPEAAPQPPNAEGLRSLHAQ